MKLLIQRVSKASVEINSKIVSSINKGYLVLVSFTLDDTSEIIDKMIDKLLKLRIFEDNEGKINLSINDIKGQILAVPQFSLYASCVRGNRPSFDKVLPSVKSKELFSYFQKKLTSFTKEENYGVFHENMQVSLINDGPFTIILDSKEIYG